MKTGLVILVAMMVALLAGCTPIGTAVRTGEEHTARPQYGDWTLPEGFSVVGTACDPASGLPMRIKCDKIDYELVLVPAGEFIMGNPVGEGYMYEHPQHRVILDAYYIGLTEVSNVQFRCFQLGHNSGSDYGLTLNDDNQPVVEVSWEDADTFCQWAGMALPTEAQWEKAARGTGGRKYPWGNDWPPPHGAGNYADATAKRSSLNWPTIENYDDSYVVTNPVGTFGTNEPYGTQDLAGNVWEWCADWYGVNYYQNSPGRNPMGPLHGEDQYPNVYGRVLRGGSWLCHDTGDIRATGRVYGNPIDRNNDCGFRGAVSVSRAGSITP